MCTPACSKSYGRPRAVSGVPGLVEVLVEELARPVLGVRETIEGLPALLGDEVRGTHRMEGHREEVDVGEVDALGAAVVHALAGEVAVEVHLAQPDGVRLVVALLNRTDGGDVAQIGHRGQPADRGLDRATEVGRGPS